MSVSARVKFTYHPQADDELALEVGTIITVLEQYDDGWWKGELNGVEGVFPENHVEVIEPNPTITNSLFLVKALFPYKAQAEDQLDLEEGDIITVVQELENGWWAGTINGKAGIFPASFTEKIADVSSAANSNPFGDRDMRTEMLKLQTQFRDAMEGMKAIIDQQHSDQMRLIAVIADLKDEVTQLKAKVGK